MALQSIHACDCANGFTYIGEISIAKASAMGADHGREELAVSNYVVISTKVLVDRTWCKEMGEDNREHVKCVPYGRVAGALYTKMQKQGTLNKKQVRLPSVCANHELDM